MRLRGILPVNKPEGISSYDCIRLIQPLFPKNKIGHAGTLDPIASGLLLLLFNEATKIAEYISSKDKEYIAKIHLGFRTDTDDITGQIIKDSPYEDISQSQLEKVLKSFIGEKDQVPPKFSALKQQGKRSYELARKGIDFIVKPRKIIIKSIELLNFELPVIEIKTTVSKGTYIRALARDIGEILGCGATLEGLIRTQIGKFRVENALHLDEVKQETIAESLYPINEALFDIPVIVISEPEIKKILKGQPLIDDSKIRRLEDCKINIENSPIRIVDEQNRILVMAKYRDNKIYPDRVIYADL